MNRRFFVRQASLASAGILLAGRALAGGEQHSFPVVRTPGHKRRFSSKSVEKLIDEVKKNIGNKEIAWMFGNCFPNTLDTTVDHCMLNGRPDTYVITGDIDAMWLRDSSAQVWPYLPLCKEDPELKLLIQGVINRQVKCILKDPYANAFYKDEQKISEWSKDETKMQPGIHERKWEIDSLCYPIRLAYGYWRETGDTTPFDGDWIMAMKKILATFAEQQRMAGKGPYSFMRSSPYATDSVPMGGYGYPAKPNGLICSMFRPSDDATVYPYLIPSNLFALSSLYHLSTMIKTIDPTSDINFSAMMLMSKVGEGIRMASQVETSDYGTIYAYETNGYGSYNLMDDANAPSLLSLPYLIDNIPLADLYPATRKFVLSADNPFFFKGTAGEGIGGPHVGMDMIWPISIIMRGLTSKDDEEIKNCITMLQKTHAGTGFMHESFHKDDPTRYTRKWFAWANTLFGEFIWKVYRERPHLLD